MSDPKNPSNPLSKPAAAASKDSEKESAGKPVDREAETSARIAQLQAQVKLLEQEIKTLEGRARNRDPRLAKRLNAENSILHARLVLLEKALFAIMKDSFQPRQPAEAELLREVLSKSAAEYFKQTNMDPELWKSIVS